MAKEREGPPKEETKVVAKKSLGDAIDEPKENNKKRKKRKRNKGDAGMKAKETLPEADSKEAKKADSKSHKKSKKSQAKNEEDSKKDDNKHKRTPWPEGEAWSKSKKKRMRILKAKMNKTDKESDKPPLKEEKKRGADGNAFNQNSGATPESNGKKSSSLQKSFRARLTGSRFRILNEELYTTASSTSYERFSENPELFEQYHEGFRHQVEQWPTNPLDVMFRWLTKRYSNSKNDVAVADFGCGDAELAKRLLNIKRNGKSPFVVHSFDLVAPCDLVTACDMSNVPLKDKTVDVGIFCLSLMGSNVSDFLMEAHRVLKDDGKVKIAEVRSRFESASGKDDLDEFVSSLQRLGFECLNVDRNNKMFVLMELKKNSKKPDPSVQVTVKPCIYKRR